MHRVHFGGRYHVGIETEVPLLWAPGLQSSRQSKERGTPEAEIFLELLG